MKLLDTIAALLAGGAAQIDKEADEELEFLRIVRELDKEIDRKCIVWGIKL